MAQQEISAVNVARNGVAVYCIYVQLCIIKLLVHQYSYGIMHSCSGGILIIYTTGMLDLNTCVYVRRLMQDKVLA